MRSESTSALGQPNETNPTLGISAAGLGILTAVIPCRTEEKAAREARPRAALRNALGESAGFLLWLLEAVGIGVGCFRFGVGCLCAEVAEGEVAEDGARLFLKLLLHIEKGIGALIEVARHQPLDRWTLHLHELAPSFGIQHRVVPEFGHALLLKAAL